MTSKNPYTVRLRVGDIVRGVVVYGSCGDGRWRDRSKNNYRHAVALALPGISEPNKNNFFSLNRAGNSLWWIDYHKIYPDTIYQSSIARWTIQQVPPALPNTSSSSTMHLPSRTEEIAIFRAIVIEAVLIVGGNLLTIFLFVLEKKLRKKSFLLVFNMAFADVLLGAVSLPLYIYLRDGFRPPKTAGGVFPLNWSVVFISCERFYAVYWQLNIRRQVRRCCGIDDETIALLPIASKFGPQEVKSFSQLCA